MKRILKALCLFPLLALMGCMQFIPSSQEANNQRLYPEKYFEPARLEMAQAIFKNDKAKVEKLLAQGINVNQQQANNIGFTYLMYAVFLDNRFEIAKLLLEHKANPNQVSKILSQNKERYVYYLPLTVVSSDQPIEYMQLLLSYGADPNYAARDEKGDVPLNARYALNSAVHSAVMLSKGNRQDWMNDIKARIDLLLSYNANINSQATLGSSVVQDASGNPEIVLYLMDKGADPQLYGSVILKAYNILPSGPISKPYREEIIRRLTALGYQPKK